MWGDTHFARHFAAALAAAAQASCPDLSPADDGTGLPLPLVMSEINPGEYFELYNPGDRDLDLSLENLWLCSPFLYADLQEVAAGVTVPAGGYATVPMPAQFIDADSVKAAARDLVRGHAAGALPTWPERAAEPVIDPSDPTAGSRA